jgi:hypothetical protein
MYRLTPRIIPRLALLSLALFLLFCFLSPRKFPLALSLTPKPELTEHSHPPSFLSPHHNTPPLPKLHHRPNLPPSLPSTTAFSSPSLLPPFDTDEAADLTLCRSTPCKLLLPGWIAEQESKASLHLHQLSLLAAFLNRTLVLPNVRKSRMGTCFPLHFSTYYAPDALGETAVEQGRWEDWARRRPGKASIQRVIVGLKPIEGGFVGGNMEGEGQRRRDCVEERWGGELRFGGWEDALILRDLGVEKNPRAFVDKVVDALGNSSHFAVPDAGFQGRSGMETPDILLVTWEPRFPIFPPSSFSLAPLYPRSVASTFVSPLPYSPTLTSLATRISTPLHPFLSIHWRTETLSPSILPSCARLLLATLESTLLSPSTPLNADIHTINLATDLPVLSGEAAKSGTYDLTAEADEGVRSREEAVRVLKGALGKYGMLGKEGLRLTTLNDELRRGDGKDLEGGVKGMDSVSLLSRL